MKSNRVNRWVSERPPTTIAGRPAVRVPVPPRQATESAVADHCYIGNTRLIRRRTINTGKIR